MTEQQNDMGTAFRDLMRTDERGRRLLEEFDALGEDVEPIAIPDETEMTAILRRWDVPEEDFPDILAYRPTLMADAELQWALDRHIAILRKYTDVPSPRVQFLDIPLDAGDVSRFYYFYVYAAMMPFILDYFAARRIPETIINATLSDMGSKARVHHKNRQVSGLASPWWLDLHFRGMIYQLGRLQFERSVLNDRLGEAVAAAGLPYGPGSRALSVHISDFMGPFPPAACDESFAQARTFFPEYFPEEEPVDIAFCYSWLLDDQLPDHLKPTSNIVQFQKRFHLAYQGDRDDASAANFIWGKKQIPPMPENPTSLERAIIGHHQNGGHWGWGAGWLLLREPGSDNR